MGEYTEYLEDEGKLDKYLEMLEQKEKVKQEHKELLKELFPMVRSALSGNGNLLVNFLIRKHREKEFFSKATADDLYDIYKFYTDRLLPFYNEFDPNKGTKQIWTNWKILSFLDKDYLKIERKDEEIRECDIVPKFQRSNKNITFTDVIDLLTDLDQPSPEDLVIIKDIIDKINIKLGTDATVFMDVHVGNIMVKDACEELEISQPTFRKRYNKFKQLLNELKKD